jgi:orotate phosphoribosyltransferase
MDANKRERLRQLIETRCLSTDAGVTLSGGSQSSFYFDCKTATLDGECLNLIVEGLLDEISRLPSVPGAVGGLTMGADFLVAPLVAKAYERGHPTVHASIVRKEPKRHGTCNRIENQLAPGTTIAVVDDVITSGSSIRQACEEFRKADYRIIGIIALIDRQAGGKESLEKDYGMVRTLFTTADFPALHNTETV